MSLPSSFRRVTKKKGSGAASLPGVKPWMGGRRLVSSGLPALDRILGGGLVLGSSYLLEEDQYTQYGRDVFKYVVQSGILSHQPCFVFVSDEVSSSALEECLAFLLGEEYLEHSKQQVNAQESKEGEEGSFYHVMDAEDFLSGTFFLFLSFRSPSSFQTTSSRGPCTSPSTLPRTRSSVYPFT